jgi:hypothetical protein
MGSILARQEQGSVGVRCVEYHEVHPGGSLPDRKHYDKGSLATIDILLSEPSDFAGGIFSTLEADGTLQQHRFGGPRAQDECQMGSGLLFVSHKYHCVSAVTRGVRRVLVIELWCGPSKSCNHRCSSPHACSLKMWDSSDFQRVIAGLSEKECEAAVRELELERTCLGTGTTARQLLLWRQEQLAQHNGE